jgi:hypothetical protein
MVPGACKYCKSCIRIEMEIPEIITVPIVLDSENKGMEKSEGDTSGDDKRTRQLVKKSHYRYKY